jgi:hypothetical protein
MELKQEQPLTTDYIDSEAQGPQLYAQQSSPSKGTPLTSNPIPEADYISFTDGEAVQKETLCKSQNLRLESRENTTRA